MANARPKPGCADLDPKLTFAKVEARKKVKQLAAGWTLRLEQNPAVRHPGRASQADLPGFASPTRQRTVESVLAALVRALRGLIP